MKKAQVQVGKTYLVKVSGSIVPVKLTKEGTTSGWLGVNLRTGREIRIRTAGRLRREVLTYRELYRELVDKLNNTPKENLTDEEYGRLQGPVDQFQGMPAEKWDEVCPEKTIRQLRGE